MGHVGRPGLKAWDITGVLHMLSFKRAEAMKEKACHPLASSL